MEKLVNYFFGGISSETLETAGAEIETQFVDSQGKAVTEETSQQMLKYLALYGWKVSRQERGLITTLTDKKGNELSYKLGRHNFELSTIAMAPNKLMSVVDDCLDHVYESAQIYGATPYFEPILEPSEDSLVIPNEKNATRLVIDGHNALSDLARTSSVQFTFSVDPYDSMRIINRLGFCAFSFVENYPQDGIWRDYIANSRANYLSDRYGGPTFFESIEEYCQSIVQHDVAVGPQLIPFDKAININIPLYLRSIWWHFQLKRHVDALCIEVRPIPRQSDNHIKSQYQTIRDMIY